MIYKLPFIIKKNKEKEENSPGSQTIQFPRHLLSACCMLGIEIEVCVCVGGGVCVI